MSIEIETGITGATVNKFWGGDDRGVCVQITPFDCDYVQLSLIEAVNMINALSEFVYEESIRRQKLLKEQMEKFKTDQKTVFDEIYNLDSELFKVQKVSVSMVDKFCPKH